jgi:hypothetical protein
MNTSVVVKHRVWILAGVGLLMLLLAFVLPAFPQPQGYHNFADQQTWLGIPHFGNVASNVAFVLVGLAGLLAMRSPAVHAMEPPPRHAYALMFLGLLFTGFGSGYYHWAPTDASLVWDRLPMTLVFMPLLAATYAERLRWRSDMPLLGLVLFGVFCVVYWKYNGNLMPYLMAQGGTVLLILLAIMLLPTPWSGRGLLYPTLVSYALAFVSENLDWQIYRWTSGVISGHTLKHLFAAFAFVFILRMLRNQSLMGKSRV